jgi:general secretion pathway protein J
MNPCVECLCSARRAGRGCAGFTLIELLIALTLVGLLSVVLVGGLRFGTRVWETGHERSESFAEIEAVHGFLRRQLSQARMSDQSTRSPDLPADFLGSGDRVRFTGTLSAYVGTGGLYRFELAPIEHPDGTSLELVWQIYRPDRSEWFDDSSTRRVLLEGIEAVRLRYFGTPEGDEESEWHEAWDSQTALPSLVRLELDFPSDDGRSWPELTVAPHAATSPAR